MSDELHYDLEMKEEPSCQVIVEFCEPGDPEKFASAIHAFAQEHGLTARPAAIPAFPTPMRILPTFCAEHLILSAFYVMHPSEGYGQARLSLLRRDHPISSFRRTADAFSSRLGDAFPTQTRDNERHEPGSA